MPPALACRRDARRHHARREPARDLRKASEIARNETHVVPGRAQRAFDGPEESRQQAYTRACEEPVGLREQRREDGELPPIVALPERIEERARNARAERQRERVDRPQRGRRPRPRYRSSRLSPASPPRARAPGRGILRHLRAGRHPGAGAHAGDPAAQLAETAHAVRRPPGEHARAARHEQPQIAAPREREEGGQDAQLDPQRRIGRDGELEERHREVADAAARRRPGVRSLPAESPARDPRPGAHRARAASRPARARDARARPGGAGSARCCTPRPRAAPPRASRPGATGTAPRGARRWHRTRRRSRPCGLPGGDQPPLASLCTRHAEPRDVAGAPRWGRTPREGSRAPLPGGAPRPLRSQRWHASRPCDSLAGRSRAWGEAMTRGSIVLLCGLLAAGVARAASDDAAPREPRATMGEIFRALAEVLPPSLDEKRFADPAQRQAILAALTRLAEAGSKLASARPQPRRELRLPLALARPRHRGDPTALRRRAQRGSALPAARAHARLRRVPFATAERARCVARAPADVRGKRRQAASRRARAARVRHPPVRARAGDERGAARLAGLQRQRPRSHRARSTNTSSSACACDRITSAPARTLERFAARADVSGAAARPGRALGRLAARDRRPQARGDAPRGGAGAARGGAGSHALPGRPRRARLRPRRLGRAAPLRRRHAAGAGRRARLLPARRDRVARGPLLLALADRHLSRDVDPHGARGAVRAAGAGGASGLPGVGLHRLRGPRRCPPTCRCGSRS